MLDTGGVESIVEDRWATAEDAKSTTHPRAAVEENARIREFQNSERISAF